MGDFTARRDGLPLLLLLLSPPSFLTHSFPPSLQVPGQAATSRKGDIRNNAQSYSQQCTAKGTGIEAFQLQVSLLAGVAHVAPFLTYLPPRQQNSLAQWDVHSWALAGDNKDVELPWDQVKHFAAPPPAKTPTVQDDQPHLMVFAGGGRRAEENQVASTVFLNTTPPPLIPK